jgi:PIN domain nuclease of toxin-antitoxin system
MKILLDTHILICQAKTENMLLMTHDSLIPFYNEPCILSV